VAERYAVWLARDAVAVRGPDAPAYLQGQLSQDLQATGPKAVWSWVLSPQGKVDALVRVTPLSGDDNWLLDTDQGWGDALVDRLNRFKLRTKVEVERLPWKVLSHRNTGYFGYGPDVIPFDWGHLQGYDQIGEDPRPPDGVPLMSAEDYDAERIVAGFPKMGAELTDKTIPAETGLIDRTVSFTKGCYTGQELVARIDSRGSNVPRRLRGLVFPEQVVVGTELVDVEGRPAGLVTSAAHSAARGWVGLGYVRRGVEVPGTVRAGDGGPDVEVRELPG
jgi:folate-binding protein YgfZ